MNKLAWLVKEHPGIQSLYRLVGSFVAGIVSRAIPVDGNLILFTSYNGIGYNDSPRAIYEYMRENYADLPLKYVWAFADPEQHQDMGCRLVKSDTPAYFLTAFKAKYWVTNVNIERGLKFKKRSQVYLNTYHGTPLKKDGRAAGHAYADYSHVDILCTDGEFGKRKLVEEYEARPESILVCGRPREDSLYRLDPESIKAIRSDYGIDPSKKVMLYAPTWREGAFAELEPPIDFAKWRAMLSDEYVLIYRAHHYARSPKNLAYGDFLIDGNEERDINRLYAIADVLISDYSSVFVDFSILERPMFCFAYDFDQYTASRGMNIDLKEHFRHIYGDEDELLNAIANMDWETERANTRRFKASFIQAGGHATEMCAKRLVALIGPDERSRA